MNNKLISLIVSIIIINILSNPATATVIVTFFPVPANYKCSCGDTVIIGVAISGKAQEFGATGPDQYSFNLVEVDGFLEQDDDLIRISGIYKTDVKDDDDVTFVTRFRLKCGNDCEYMEGDGIERFDIVINGSILEKPIPIDAPWRDRRAGEYVIDNFRDDDDTSGIYELAIHPFPIERKLFENVGYAKFICEDIDYLIDAKIDEEKYPQKTLEVKIPRTDVEEKSFYIDIESYEDVYLYNAYIKWKDKKPKAVDYPINMFATEKRIMAEQSISEELKFKVKPEAEEGEYDFEIDIYYYYFDGDNYIYGVRKVDPTLILVKPKEPKPTPTLPTDHPPVPPEYGGLHAKCHPQIRGSSIPNLFGPIILSIFLLAISLLVLRKKR